ncbi:MAG: bifunctional hydroxymethylpyrimidine kinase/phosphomethylpyrimidine kinase [Candidatus Theseobacter exili]|nr:bifunctional hydroxymethylpyrimidine kinase/phosphomethylpyrimidine kinase [Candidatus Theseobacter exili]
MNILSESMKIINKHAALVVAGSDSCGGAGIQADMFVLNKLEVAGYTAITAITAQVPGNILGIWEVNASAVIMQIDSALETGEIEAIKTGMLTSSKVVEAVFFSIAKLKKKIPLIIDPVIYASDGTELIDNKGIALLKNKLLPLASLVTPNVNEAQILSGIDIRNDNDMINAAKNIISQGSKAVLITSGDLPGDPVDIFVSSREVIRYKKKRLKGQFHGSGCRLASAITAYVAKGYSIIKAVEKAEQVISKLLINNMCIMD